MFAGTSTDEAAIRAIRVESNHAIQQGNIDAFAASLTPDFVMVRGSSAFASREAYVAAFAQDFKDPGGNEAYGGTYLAMWRHTDGGWKIRSGLFVVLTCADEAACTAYRATGAQK